MQFDKHFQRFAALMMVMMLGVAGFSGVAAATSDVSGTVTDSDGNAVADATVEAINSSGDVVASGTTASDGSYSLTGLSDNTDYTLAVTASGYDDASKSFSTGSGTSETVDISMTTSTYTVGGTVTDSTGTAIENASVTITDSSGVEVGQTKTDSNGHYSISGVEHGTEATIEVAADGYVTASKTVTVDSATTADFSLSTASYSYAATVEDSSGTAISSATVELLDSDGNVVSSGTTDTNGQVSVSAPSGSYDVRISASGYDSATGTADLSTSGDSGTFQLAESTYVLDGTVTDSSGNAIGGASVTLLDSSGATVKEVSTASDGTYSFSGVKSGDYTVEVAASDYEAGSKSVTVDGATTADFQLTQNVWTATYDRPADSTPGVVFAEFEASGDAIVTVEAHNASSGSWETVIDQKQFTVDGSADTPHLVEIDLDGYAGEDYDQYRVTVENVKPANTGVAEESTGGGGLPGSGGGVPFAVIVVGGGLLLAGGAAIAFEE